MNLPSNLTGREKKLVELADAVHQARIAANLAYLEWETAQKTRRLTMQEEQKYYERHFWACSALEGAKDRLIQYAELVRRVHVQARRNRARRGRRKNL